jgi:hypothetical protein
MQHDSDDPAHLAVLEELRLQTALAAAATAVWRVSQEPLDLLGYEPLPTHG